MTGLCLRLHRTGGMFFTFQAISGEGSMQRQAEYCATTGIIFF